MDELVMVLC
jgi:hypothetical protein